MLKLRMPGNVFGLAGIALLMVAGAARSDIRLDGNFYTDRSVSPAVREAEGLEEAAIAYSKQLSAITPADSVMGRPEKGLSFKLYFDDIKYYIVPVRFMARDRPGEACTPADFKGAPTYMCKEGQRYKDSCHLIFLDDNLKPAGAYRIRIDEPFDVFCNADIAMGVYDKKKNELLVTFQYFPIDRKAASKISEVGSGWIRMTSLFRLKQSNGRIEVEQDDTCLKNPNRIETIPDARKELRACGARLSK